MKERIKRWFTWFKQIFIRNKKPITTEEVLYDITNHEDRYQWVMALCDQINTARADNQHLQPEYQALCSLLSDYQKINQLPIHLRQEIEERGKEIIKYKEEKSMYEGAKEIDPKYEILKPYEDEIEEILKKVKELEERQALIKRDIEHLEGEKAELKFQRKKVATQQAVVRVITIVFFSFFSLLALLFMTLMTIYNKDVLIPSMVLLIIAIFYVLFIFTFRRRILIKTIKNDKQQARAAELLNKVKIKYVNTTNFLEYEYRRFKVNSSDELRFLWESYSKQKREQKIFREATFQLGLLEEELVKMLEQYGVEKPYRLLSDYESLADGEKREQKMNELFQTVEELKAQTQYHHSTIKTSLKQIKTLIDYSPEHVEEIFTLLERNKISLKELDK